MRPGSRVHWSSYPALLFVGAVAAGILLDHVVGPGPVSIWLVGGGLGLAVIGGAEWGAHQRMVSLGPLGRVAGVVLLLLCAGGARHAVYRAPSPQALEPIAEATENTVTVRGVVDDAPERSDRDTRFTVAVHQVGTDRDTISADGKARVTLRPPPWADAPTLFPRLQEGDRVQLRGTVRPAPGQRNPGGFDYASYLARRGTCCTMYVGAPEDVTIRARAEAESVRLVVAGRKYLRTQIQRYVPSEGGRAVLQALLLGDRGRITDARRDDFARTGLMHLLAVSGLHVFLVGMVFYVLLRPLLLRVQVPWWSMELGRSVLTIGLLGFYMVLTGGRPSVVRAVIMATLFIGSVVLQRSSHPLNTLGVAALVLIAARPTALFDVGFQLSMSAVAGIVTLQPQFAAPIPNRWRRWAAADYAVSLVVTSAAAVLATAPVLLLHFGWVSIGGLLLNVAGIPFTALGLSAALAMVIAGGMSTVAGAAFGSAADLFVQGLLWTSEWGADWLSWAGIRMADPDVWVIGALLAGIVSLAQWPRPRVRWRCIVGGLLLSTISVWSGAWDEAGTLDVIFFDVGNGDAALVSTPLDRHILVDTGPRSPMGSAASYSVLPYLQHRGIRHLDAVIVSHPDEDHLGGLPTVLREVSVGRVFHNGRAVGTELYAETQSLLSESRIPSRSVQQGETWTPSPHLQVQFLAPPSPETFDSVNEGSVVVLLRYGQVKLLFPGDVEAGAEEMLVRAYGSSLRSDVVKVPHHGSKTSSTPPFVQAAADSTDTHAVVSVGEDNPYGMPHEQVLGRWQEGAEHVHRTSVRGAVWLRTDGRDTWRIRWK